MFNGVMHGTVYTHKPAKSLMHRLNEILADSITNDLLRNIMSEYVQDI